MERNLNFNIADEEEEEKQSKFSRNKYAFCNITKNMLIFYLV